MLGAWKGVAHLVSFIWADKINYWILNPVFSWRKTDWRYKGQGIWRHASWTTILECFANFLFFLYFHSYERRPSGIIANDHVMKVLEYCIGLSKTLHQTAFSQAIGNWRTIFLGTSIVSIVSGVDICLCIVRCLQKTGCSFADFLAQSYSRYFVPNLCWDYFMEKIVNGGVILILECKMPISSCTYTHKKLQHTLACKTFEPLR